MAGGFLQRRSVRVGIPFLMLIVGGSFGLKEFTQLRYDFRNSRNITKEEAEKLGVEMKDATSVTLEAIYSDISEIDTTNWENKRGPRPWEESNQLYLEAVERGKILKENAQ
ncbi:cytochrome c oxidase assembly protein COX16 homolog, mitochondrial-like [Macrobrachium nipponense]|uniref:cytochrome c oxidase assembly protein COX16 homolog, mitochondrial-like n=1 Tax=Macrobrachium nipponense TaxID=159736 RepID=UPI0030C8723A